MRVRGPVNISRTRRLGEAAVAALEQGDIDALFRTNRAEFGGATMMADADDDDDEDDDDDADSGGGDDTGSDKDSNKDDESDDDDREEQLSRLRKRMKAADKRASDLEKQVKELLAGKGKDDDKDREPDAVAQQKITELESQVETLTSERDRLRLEKAFLSSNDHEWHDPDTALDLAHTKGFLEDVLEEDGEVSKRELRKALTRLAKEHKYLVREAEKKGKKKKDDDEPPPPASGAPSSGRSKNGDDAKARTQQLKKRFPVLNR